MIQIKNAECPPDDFYFFWAVSACVTNRKEFPSNFQVMLAVGGRETGAPATDITYSAMPRFMAFAPRKDWRFNIEKYTAFGLAGLICDTQYGWRIDGMVDRTAIWRAWKTMDAQLLAQQIGIKVDQVEKLPKCADFDEFAERIIVPLMPRRKKIIQMAWNSLKAISDCHWRGEYLYRKPNKWQMVSGHNYGENKEVAYHNWNKYPVWNKNAEIEWKKSKHIIGLNGKFLCGPTIRTLNREVMSIVEKLEAGTFGA